MDEFKFGNDLFNVRRFIISKDSKKTERGLIFDDFLAHLNPSRIKMKLPPLSHSRLGRIFEGVPTSDLYYLQSVCKQAKNYSAEFWNRTKPKPVGDKPT